MAENPTGTATSPATPAHAARPAPAPSTGDVDEIVENMERSKAASQGGGYPSLLAEITPMTEAETLPDMPPPTMTVIANELLMAAKPAELATTIPAPGLTERGWSPEVTARHPEMLAAALEEMAASAGGGGDPEPIDPTDPAALAQAQTELAYVDVLKNNLKMAAAQLNGEKLGAALDAAAAGRTAARAALEQAIDETRITVEAHATERAADRGEKRAARAETHPEPRK